MRSVSKSSRAVPLIWRKAGAMHAVLVWKVPSTSTSGLGRVYSTRAVLSLLGYVMLLLNTRGPQCHSDDAAPPTDMAHALYDLKTDSPPLVGKYC